MPKTDVAASAELDRERVAYLEALMSDPDAEPTQEEADDWFAAVDASKPRGRMIYEDRIPIGVDNETEWDAWNERPITETLFSRPSSAAPLRATPSQRGQAVVRSRGTSRERRNRSTRGKSSSRGDPDPEPPLTRLQRVRLAISDARRARLGPDDWRECPACLREFEPTEFRGRRTCRSCESRARLARFEAAA